MKKILTSAFALLSLSVLSSANAQTTPQSAVEALMQCDGNFFKEIKNIPSLKGITSQLNTTNIEAKGSLSIPLNYTSPEGIKINKFTIDYSDFDSLKKLGISGPQGKFYYWGFETKQSLKQIISLLSKNNQLIQDRGIYIYNPMIKTGKNGKWQPNRAALHGTMPKPKVAEKVLIIEQSKKTNVVSISCTLQGNVSKQDLIAAGLHKK
ncbi:hypothetical protein [Bartonella sp. HY406]|uniref:hypothetical protein n=1 Tax=Bartonella sp. HY406 TaxID=2979331 RepID=UPI0021C7461C|nr:hypothetical protein [Bartonella sp. HY406]UXN02862.1 hypothetical protein N6B01_10345 [Bartonella sp. HY406]